MGIRLIRAVLVMALAALLGNAHCVDNCSAPKPPVKECPLHKSSGKAPAECQSQHPQLADSSAGKIQIDHAPATVFEPAVVAVTSLRAVSLRPREVSQSLSPPRHPLVLRI
jgi:hypothetical protein